VALQSIPFSFINKGRRPPIPRELGSLFTGCDQSPKTSLVRGASSSTPAIKGKGSRGEGTDRRDRGRGRRSEQQKDMFDVPSRAKEVVLTLEMLKREVEVVEGEVKLIGVGKNVFQVILAGLCLDHQVVLEGGILQL